MSWGTVIWSVGGGACLTLALMHFVVWWKDRAARANLVFAGTATTTKALPNEQSLPQERVLLANLIAEETPQLSASHVVLTR